MTPAPDYGLRSTITAQFNCRCNICLWCVYERCDADARRPGWSSLLHLNWTCNCNECHPFSSTRQYNRHTWFNTYSFRPSQSGSEPTHDPKQSHTNQTYKKSKERKPFKSSERRLVFCMTCITNTASRQKQFDRPSSAYFK